jgi:putative ABC transport system permease protein
LGIHPEKGVGLKVSFVSTPHFHPPAPAERLLGLILDEAERSVRLGDLEEHFQFQARERRERRARAWYRRQVFKLALLSVVNHILWSGIMFKNNLVIAWRNIKRNKAYSALNVLGLAAGLAVFILIMLFVRTELSYDRYHANARNIYRVIQEQPDNDYLGSKIFAITPPPLAPALVQEFPEVRAATRIDYWIDVLISAGEKTFLEKRVFWADPQTFEIFSFPLVRGDRVSALKDPSSVLLSERAARRFFGEADPINRTVVLQAFGLRAELKVAGIFRDIPANSHFVMDVVAPFETMAKLEERNLTRWGGSSDYTYVLLRDGTDFRALDSKLPAFVAKYSGGKTSSRQGQKARFFLQPLTRIHLHSRANFDILPGGDARFVLLFASIAFLVLAIACVNYMNLAAARSIKRAKEVGLRKVVGAGQGQLVRQFLGDSMVLTFIALLLAVGFVLAALPVFQALVERPIVFSPFRDIALMPGLILIAAFVGAIAGSYPAFFVSAFRPVAVLKSGSASRAKGKGLRNALIFFQFAASIALIICTLGVRSQLRFIRKTDMGYDRNQVLVLSPRGGVQAGLEAFKTELRRNPAVLGVSYSRCLPDNVDSNTIAGWPGRPEGLEIPIYVIEADYDFLDLYGLKLARGRNFSRSFPSDAGGAFLINETAQKALGWDDPIGREFYHWRNKDMAGKIVGVVKDFHMHSLRLPIEPLYIFLNPKGANHVSIKIRGENIPATLAYVRDTWRRFEPNYPFEYQFFDEIFDRAYRNEQRMGTIFTAFAGLAVFIACLGLVGLASFTAEQKTREIGIRKVLGASSSGVVIMLSREFMKWVVAANLIAWPLGYFAMRTWLQNFAYRTSLTVPMFLGAALAAFIVAAAVIGLQTLRAATANPAESMRHE